MTNQILITGMRNAFTTSDIPLFASRGKRGKEKNINFRRLNEF